MAQSIFPELQDRFKFRDTEIFMSVSRLHLLCSLVGNVENVGLLLVDPKTQNQVLQALFVKFDKYGNPITDSGLDDMEFSLSEISPLLGWATEHIIDFFGRGVESIASLVKKIESLQEKLSTPTPSGLPA